MPTVRNIITDEEVGRHGEHGARLLHAAQVHEHDEADQRHGERHPVGEERREGRRDLRDAGRDRDGDRQDVVGQQRRAGHLRRRARPGCRGRRCRRRRRRGRRGSSARRRWSRSTSRATIAMRDREHVATGRPCPPRQDDQDLLGGVGGRGQRVRGEDGQADHLADRLVRRVRGRQRPADQPARQLELRRAFDSRCICAADVPGRTNAGLRDHPRARSHQDVGATSGWAEADRGSASVDLQPVADARLGEQVAGTGRIVLELVAELRHVDAQVVRLVAEPGPQTSRRSWRCVRTLPGMLGQGGDAGGTPCV